jgi:isopenicillin N synthase-like dioxygenase
MALELPSVDAQKFLEKAEGWEEEAKKAADCLHNYGVVVLKDARVNEKDNEDYCEMVEKYFSLRGEQYYKGEEIKDIKPEIHYQQGATPEFVEKARNHCARFAHYDEDDKPISECPPVFDAKWRFFWNIGERPADRKPEHEKVVPEEFPTWEETMDRWGGMMLEGCLTVAKMAAVGMDLPEDTFSERMNLGNHLLAPTGSDLRKYDVGTVFAGVHYDLNFLTIHGKSPFPGLYIWTREGKKTAVKVPDGCLILQAGIQFERITGGFVMAGYHEVIYTEATKEKVDARVAVNPD